jgi:hypothetical protein
MNLGPDGTDPEFYVADTNTAKTLHSTGDCTQLGTANRIRPALPDEIDDYAECCMCCDTPGPKGRDMPHYQAARTHDPESESHD